MSTALSLYDAQGILATLMETRDNTVCAICSEKLGTKSYLICRFPDAPAGTRGIPEEHEGHTACETCAKDRTLYVGEGGSCKACFDALGGRRTAVAKSGVALIPAVLNSMANTMMTGFLAAEQHIQDAQDAADNERIQEGSDRRAAAVEEVRRRRAAAEAEAAVEVRRLREEAEAEALRFKEEAEAEALRFKEEAAASAAAAETEAKRVKEEAEAEASRVTEQAKEEARARTEFEDRQRELRRQQEDREREERHRQEDATRAAAAAAATTATTTAAPPTRKRKAQSQETIDKRKEKSRATREAKKHKLDNYDALVSERDLLQEKLKAVIDLAKTHIRNLEGNADTFEEEVDSKLLEMDGFLNGEDEEEEEEPATMVD